MGLIADIQYAPIPDGHSYAGIPRYYRHSLETARTAFAQFQAEGLPLVANLGDSVDGKVQDLEAHGGEPLPPGIDPGHEALDHVVEALSVYDQGTILHAYGNHCLYACDRPHLQKNLGIPFVQEPCGELVGYYSHVHGGVRFIVVDSYDVAKMKRCSETSRKHRQAVEILQRENPNYSENENSPAGLEHLQRRFVAFNGAVGPIQLEWLRNELTQAQQSNEKVIILSHQPILPESTSTTCLMWNYHEVLDVLREFSTVVVASFSGHAHKGGYSRDDESGIHFRVFEASLENPDPHKTYAMVDFYEDRVVIRGFGNCESAEYDMSHLVDGDVKWKERCNQEAVPLETRQ